MNGQVGDIFTKELGLDKLQNFSALFGLQLLYVSSLRGRNSESNANIGTDFGRGERSACNVEGKMNYHMLIFLASIKLEKLVGGSRIQHRSFRTLLMMPRAQQLNKFTSQIRCLDPK